MGNCFRHNKTVLEELCPTVFPFCDAVQSKPGRNAKGTVEEARERNVQKTIQRKKERKDDKEAKKAADIARLNNNKSLKTIGSTKSCIRLTQNVNG